MLISFSPDLDHAFSYSATGGWQCLGLPVQWVVRIRIHLT